VCTVLTKNAPWNKVFEFCLLFRKRKEVDIEPALTPPLEKVVRDCLPVKCRMDDIHDHPSGIATESRYMLLNPFEGEDLCRINNQIS
jgi:hypothetical protein